MGKHFVITGSAAFVNTNSGGTFWVYEREYENAQPVAGRGELGGAVDRLRAFALSC